MLTTNSFKSNMNNREPKLPKMEVIRKLEADDTLIPLEDFFSAYFDCRKHKRSTPNARHFEINFEEKLIELWYEVNTKKYEIGTSICFLVKRPKLREVFAADFRDRIVHHIIMMRLEPLFEDMFINDTYNCRKGRGTLFGINRLYEMINEASENYTKNVYIGKFDLQGFFMSIHKPTLWKFIREFINENYHGKDKELLLYLVKKVILHHPERNCKMKTPSHEWKKLPKNKSLFTCGVNKGLAIGNLTSQCFANFYMHFFDDFMSTMFKFYGRYVDDYFVIAETKEEILSAIPKMKHFLMSVLKLKLHPDKTYIQTYDKGVKFTGSVIKGKRRYIGNQTVAGMHNKIELYNQNISKEYVDKFVSTLNSYFGFLKHYETFAIKYRMIMKINRNWLNYIDIVNLSKAQIRGYIKESLIVGKELNDGNGMDKYYSVENKYPIDSVYLNPELADKLNIKPDLTKIFGTLKERVKLTIHKENSDTVKE